MNQLRHSMVLFLYSRCILTLSGWVKRDQLDVTCFIISLFNAQHVSDVNTSILRSLRLMCYFMGCIALVRCVLVLRCGMAVMVWYPYAGWGTASTQHDVLPQHPVYKNELNCGCYNIILARKNIAPWWLSKKDRNMLEWFEVFLIVFMWNLCKCNCWLIIEVILRNARCNSKVYGELIFRMAVM